MSAVSAENRRQHFRVTLFKPIEGLVRFKSVNGKIIGPDKILPVLLLDLSASGAKIESKIDIPLKLEILLSASFEFEHEQFNFDCRMVRKKDQNGEIQYGLKFIGSSEMIEKKLINCLNTYQIKNTSVQSQDLKLNNLKFTDVPIDKILEVFPYSAILMTENRFVLFGNKLAHEIGALSHHQCHQKIFENEKVCSHCRMEASFGCNEQVNCQVVVDIRGKNYIPYWLFLNNDMFLHYFKEI